MATTTNYGWTTPDNTALVKDGALAIRTLGSSVDTTTKALNPSTTLGDIEYRSATANTNTRLGIGSSGTVLTVSAGVPAWSALPSSGAYTSIASGSLSGSTVTISSIPSTYTDLYLLVKGSNLSTDAFERIRPNGSSATNYISAGIYGRVTDTFSSVASSGGSGIGMNLPNIALNKGGITTNTFALSFYNYASTTEHKVISAYFTPWDASANTAAVGFSTTRWSVTDAISSIDILTNTGTFSGGTYQLFGVK
jgi:hypothetical protein